MISVLIPVYNVEKKINKFRDAIDSVLNQSYRDFEILIINDGSTDKTEQVLTTIQKTDRRIRFVTNENGGVESARRYGLKCVNGDYILHMDQDDIYRNDAFDVFVRKIEESEADVVIANHIRFILFRQFSFGRYKGQSMQIEKVLDHKSFMDYYYRSFFGINDLPVNIWNKMYRKSFLDKIPIPPLTGHIIEDLSYNMHVLPYATRIVLLPDVLYYYRWGGYTNQYDKTVLETALIGYNLKMKLIEKYKAYQFKVSVSVELLNYLNTHFSQLVEYKKCSKDDFITECKMIFSKKEVMEGIEIVKSFDRYHNEYIDVVLNQDSLGLYEYEIKLAHRNRFRNFVKNNLLKL